MGISWSKMRKILEQDNICDSLKGRVQYFVTRYRKIAHQEGRVAILVDKKEIYLSDFYNRQSKRFVDISYSEWLKKNIIEEEQKSSEVNNHMLEKGGFNQAIFYKSFYIYFNNSIEESLYSENPIVRLFAILDKRVGKRTLKKLALEVDNQAEWLQPFYTLRLTADKIIESPK